MTIGDEGDEEVLGEEGGRSSLADLGDFGCLGDEGDEGAEGGFERLVVLMARDDLAVGLLGEEPAEVVPASDELVLAKDRGVLGESESGGNSLSGMRMGGGRGFPPRNSTNCSRVRSWGVMT